MDEDPSAAPTEPSFATRWARTGWRRAGLGALIAAGAGLLVAEIAAVGFALAGGTPGSAPTTVRVGALLFSAFHHVPLVFDATLRPLAGVRSGHVSVSLTAAPMLGTLVVGGALFFAGRSVARAANTPGILAGGAQGAKIAVPYGILCGAVAALAHVTVRPSGTAQALFAGPFTVGPAIGAAFLWPSLLAAVAGFAGGASSVGTPRASARSTGGFDVAAPASVSGPAAARPATVEPAARAASAAISGGGAMAAVALVLSFAGLLVLAAVDTNATRAYFHGAFERGSARGAAAIGLTALGVPNMATWVLEPSMGSCLSVARTSHADACVVSYRRVPGSDPLGAPAGNGRRDRRPPAAYLLFLLAPATAVLAGGWAAARRSGAAGVAASMGAGVLAGVVFAAWSVVFVLMSRMSVSIGGSGAAGVGGSETLTIGPAMLLSTAVSAAWGVLGGGAGGAISALVVRRRGVPVRERVFAVPATPPEEGSG